MLEGTETREASAAGKSAEAVDAAEAAANGVTIVDGRLQEIAFPELGFSMRFVDAHELTGQQIDEAVELLRLAFNGGPGWFSLPVRQADHLRWKLVDPPFDSSVALFEDETGRLVGFTGILDRQWRVRGQDRTGRDGVELALHPDHQGGGLFRKLMGLRDLVPDDSDFWLAFSSHPGLKKVRPPEVELLANEIDNLVRPLSVTRYVRQREDLSARPTTSRTRIAIESAERRRRRRPKIVKWAAWQSRMLR